MARVFKKKKNSSDWWIDYKDAFGRRKREKVGPNQELAVQVLGELLKRATQERELGIKHIDKMAFSDFGVKYLETHAKPNKRSWKRDETIIDKHLAPLFSKKFLTEIAAEDLEKYKIKRAEKVSNSTINRELDCIKMMFAKAVEWGNLRENPAKNVKDLQVDNRLVVFLEKEECEQLLKACSKFFRPITETFILTGMRLGELLNLKWSDIDSKNNVLHIMRGSSNSELTKGGAARTLPLQGRLLKVLQKVPRHISNEYVFCQSNGKPWKDLRGSLASAVKAAAIGKHVTFHTLRHTYASHLVMAGVDLYTVSVLLGHSSIEMTQRYAHLSPDHKARAMARLDEYFKEGESSRVNSSSAS